MTSPPTVVLLYHRVIETSPDPHGLQVSPARFEAQLEALARAVEIVPLAALRSAGSRPRAAVTLDDGYVDNLELAKPILDRLGLPATVFVTSGLVGSRAGFWQDRLADLLLRAEIGCSHLVLDVAGTTCVLHTATTAARQRAYRFLHARLRRRKPGEIEATLTQVSDQAGRSAVVAPSSLPLTAEQVRALVTGGSVVVGAHTVHHAMLATLDEDEQRFEIGRSRADLEKLVGGPVDLFAYPFGDVEDFDGTSVRVAREHFSLAATAMPGRVRPEGDPHRLPRIAVGDWEEPEFRARLDGWLTARS